MPRRKKKNKRPTTAKAAQVPATKTVATEKEATRPATAAVTKPKTNSQTLPAKDLATLELIRRQYDSKHYKKAIKACDGILARHPRHGETLSLKGLHLNALKRKEEALECCKLGLMSDLKNYVCWHLNGLVYRNQGKFKDAIKCYSSALRFAPENLQILKDLAMLQIQRRLLPGYTETRRKILVLKSSAGANWIMYAIGNHLTGNYAKALTVLDSYEKMDLTHDAYQQSELQLYRNQIIRESGDWKATLAHLEAKAHVFKDPISVNEIRAEAYLALNQEAKAELIYHKLIDIIPENYEYHRGLLKAKGLQHVPGTEPSAQVQESRRELYTELGEKFPRCAAVQRLPLDYLNGAEFEQALSAYMQKRLIRGVPSLFVDLEPLYTDLNKRATIERMVTGFATQLAADSRFTDDSKDVTQTPAALLWTLYYCGQHFDSLGNHARALEFVEQAIQHTPTTMDLYVLKARILKHAGDAYSAFAYMDKARRMDTADRYLNTKCVRYAFRAGKIQEAERIVALFLRESKGLDHLFDMQCMWYELSCGNAHENAGDIFAALKQYLAVDAHMTSIQEGQSDFHTYCMRKMAVRAYVKMLRWEDTLKDHKYFYAAAQKLVPLFLELHNRLPGMESFSDYEDMDAEERKRWETERERLLAIAKEDHKAAVEAERKAASKKTRDDEEEDDGPVHPLELDPLTEATRLVEALQAHAPEQLYTSVLGCQLFLRKGKFLPATKALKKAVSLAPTDPEVHKCVVSYQRALTRDLGNEAEVVQKLLGAERKNPALGGAGTLEALNDAFLAANAASMPHVLAGAQVMLKLSASNKARAVEVVAGSLALTEGQGTWRQAKAALDFLQKQDATVAERFRTECHIAFPLCAHFLDSETLVTLKNDMDAMNTILVTDLHKPL